MTIKQLSVFLENKTGRINEVVRILGANEINMHAFSMAESTDFGILRLIVSDVDKAVEVLRSHDFAVMFYFFHGFCCSLWIMALHKTQYKPAKKLRGDQAGLRGVPASPHVFHLPLEFFFTLCVHRSEYTRGGDGAERQRKRLSDTPPVLPWKSGTP